MKIEISEEMLIALAIEDVPYWIREWAARKCHEEKLADKLNDALDQKLNEMRAINGK